MDQNYKVYMYENQVNHKKYIGLTKQTIEKRSGYTGLGYNRCSKFWNAIEKYGWDNFTCTVVADGLTKSKASRLEMELIARYKTMDREYGYNIAEGGFAPSVSEETRQKMSASKMGHVVTEETRQKLREKNKGQIVTEEQRRKMSESRKGKPRPKEVCEKMSKAMKGRKRPENAGAAPRKVRCIETGIVYPSIAEAARQTNSLICKISSVCSGQRRSTNHLHWEYA